MLPKLAVFDVDGTLVSYDGGCSPAVRTALTRLRSAGVVTAIATGRPRQAIAETLAMVGPVDYAVCGNGSTVTHVETDRVIRRSVVPGDLTERLVPAVRGAVPRVAGPAAGRGANRAVALAVHLCLRDGQLRSVLKY